METRNRGEILQEAIDTLKGKSYFEPALINIVSPNKPDIFLDKLSHEISGRKTGGFTKLQFEKIVSVMNKYGRLLLECAEEIECAHIKGAVLSPEEQAEIYELERQSKPLRLKLQKLTVESLKKNPNCNVATKKDWKQLHEQLDPIEYKISIKDKLVALRDVYARTVNTVDWDYIIREILHKRSDWFNRRKYGEKNFKSEEYNKIVEELRNIGFTYNRFAEDLKAFV